MRYVEQGNAHEPYDWPDGVVITDPPFAVGKVYAGVTEVVTFREHVRAVLAIGAELSIIRAPAEALWSGIPRPKAVIIETRTFGMAMPNRRLRRWQPWLVYGSTRGLRGDLPDWFSIGPSHNGRADRVAVPAIGRSLGDHPGMTPPDATAAIIGRVRWDRFTNRVLDPFAGMGGIGTVAITLDLDYRGMEVVPEYAAVAESRCMQAAGAVLMPLGL